MSANLGGDGLEPGVVSFVSTDLFLASGVRGPIESAGLAFRQCRSVDAIPENGAVVVDLLTPGLDLALLRESAAGRPLIGFAPHVRGELLAAARQAGFDRVVPRSKLDATVRALAAEASQTRPPEA